MGEQAGYLSKMSFRDGSVLIIISLKAAFIFSISSGEGCAGAGKPGLPLNIINTGTGPFTFTGTTSIMLMSTLINGYSLLSTCPTKSFAMTGVRPTNSLSTTFTVQVTFGIFF